VELDADGNAASLTSWRSIARVHSIKVDHRVSVTSRTPPWARIGHRVR